MSPINPLIQTITRLFHPLASSLASIFTSGSAAVLFRLAFAFAKTGLFTFGSGYAMLSLMQKEVVDNYAWLTPEQFADIVAISEITPGPITVNMATFVGYRVAGIIGAIAATLGLITGPVLAILIITRFYNEFRGNKYVDAVFRGIRPAVLALITIAIIRLSKTAIIDFKGAIIFTGLLAALYFLKLNPIIAALIGIVAGLVLY